MPAIATLRAVTAADAALLPELSALLRDAVDGGASVGFLGPLPEAEAAAYWEGVLGALGPGLQLWMAEAEGAVVGSVQLAPCLKPNGRHRAEIQKLFVHSAWRGRGLASALMATAEAHARAAGRTLLVLDTQAGSAAEAVYRHLGWTRAGEVPDYAAAPDGTLRPTVLYYKHL